MSLTVLDGSTFCVCDERGDVDGVATASGFFAADTRFLSRSVLTLAGARLDPLSHAQPAPHLATFMLRNPHAGGLVANELSIERERFVGDCMEERITVENHGRRRVEVELALELEADFADIFVVKSLEPGFGEPITGTLPPPCPLQRVGDNGTLVFADEAFPVRTIVHLSEPWREDDGKARFPLVLEPGDRWQLAVFVQPQLDGAAAIAPASVEHELDEEHRHADESLASWLHTAPRLHAPWDDLVHTYNRSVADLAALRMRPDGDFGQLLAAGAPWFMTVFGRDTLISALQTLVFGPELATTTLRALAATQATADDPVRDAEPGKIIHEVRRGKAALAWADRYYGATDSTPLFLILMSELWRWSGDDALPRELESNARRALDWIDHWGDRDGDGFVEYVQRAPIGIVNQTWKDSTDSMAFHDGTLARAPIAPVEVQGYVYDAKLRAAELAREVWSDPALADRLERDAALLQERFDAAFWVADRGFYALALDAEKHQVDSLTSNVGHLLWSGIVPERRREAVAELLLADGLWSGWGVRTMAQGEGAYNPLVYHNGTVWPHDNSLVAWGLARIGRRDAVHHITHTMVEVATFFGYRLPEVFAGFPRERTQFPVVYPTASSPQAWAAATPVLLLRIVLGLVPDRRARVLRSDAAELPDWAEGIVLEGVHAFGREWTARVVGGAVTVD